MYLVGGGHLFEAGNEEITALERLVKAYFVFDMAYPQQVSEEMCTVL